MSTRELTEEELQQQLEEIKNASDLRLCRDPSILLPKATEAMDLRDSAVVAVVKLLADPPVWEVQTTKGTVRMAGDEIASRLKFKRRMIDTLSEVVTDMRPKEWDEVVRLLMQAHTVENIGDEATDAGACATWLAVYLTAKEPRDLDLDDEHHNAVSTRHPFRYRKGDGPTYVYIFGEEFRKWLLLSRGEKLTGKRMGVILRAGGHEDVQLDLKIKGQRVAPRVWRLRGEVEPTPPPNPALTAPLGPVGAYARGPITIAPSKALVFSG